MSTVDELGHQYAKKMSIEVRHSAKLLIACGADRDIMDAVSDIIETVLAQTFTTAYLQGASAGGNV